jgi:hypothetical protein
LCLLSTQVVFFYEHYVIIAVFRRKEALDAIVLVCSDMRRNGVI